MATAPTKEGLVEPSINGTSHRDWHTVINRLKRDFMLPENRAALNTGPRTRLAWFVDYFENSIGYIWPKGERVDKDFAIIFAKVQRKAERFAKQTTERTFDDAQVKVGKGSGNAPNVDEVKRCNAAESSRVQVDGYETGSHVLVVKDDNKPILSGFNLPKTSASPGYLNPSRSPDDEKVIGSVESSVGSTTFLVPPPRVQVSTRSKKRRRTNTKVRAPRTRIGDVTSTESNLVDTDAGMISEASNINGLALEIGPDSRSAKRQRRRNVKHILRSLPIATNESRDTLMWDAPPVESNDSGISSNTNELSNEETPETAGAPPPGSNMGIDILLEPPIVIRDYTGEGKMSSELQVPASEPILLLGGKVEAKEDPRNFITFPVEIQATSSAVEPVVDQAEEIPALGGRDGGPVEGYEQLGLDVVEIIRFHPEPTIFTLPFKFYTSVCQSGYLMVQTNPISGAIFTGISADTSGVLIQLGVCIGPAGIVCSLIAGTYQEDWVIGPIDLLNAFEVHMDQGPGWGMLTYLIYVWVFYQMPGVPLEEFVGQP